MCWMTIRREPNALARGIDKTRHGEGVSGGHSWGYATSIDDELYVSTDVGRIPPDLSIPEVDNALVHTRFTTRGAINKTNAHPFRIEHRGETVGAMSHNGTWYGAPETDGFSDTYHMANLLTWNYRRSGSFKSAFIATAEHTGETMVALDKSGVGYVYAGRFSIMRDGSVFASTGHEEELSTGEVYRIETNGEVEKLRDDVGSHHPRRHFDL